MRLRHYIALLLLSSTAAHAQRDQTLVGGNSEFGGFGGPTASVGPILGETGLFVGGRGAFLIGRRFAIGGGGVGLTNDIPVLRQLSSRRTALDFGYGGVTLEVITQPSKLVHVTGGVLLGGGEISLRPLRGVLDVFPPIGRIDDDADGDGVAVVEPELGIELNVTNWMRVGVGGTYRFVTGATETADITNARLSGGTARLTFKFGKF